MTNAPKNKHEKNIAVDNEIVVVSDIINVLGEDFSNIYCVSRDGVSVDIYRY